MEKVETPKFKLDLALLTKMQHLRLWNIAYAPSRRAGLLRMQELHQLHNEWAWKLVQGMQRFLAFYVIFAFCLYKAFTSWRIFKYGN